MSWSFRALVLSVTLVCGLAPQIACFMPDQLTQSEMDCCQKMADLCGQMNMSCCRTVIRDEVAVTAKPGGTAMPSVDIAPKPMSISVLMPPTTFTAMFPRLDNAPPPDIGASSLILRI
jgi:hypothetical protein